MMDLWKMGLSTLIGLGCLAMLATPLARAESTPNLYPEKAVNEILDNCRQETETFLPPDFVEPLCQCVLTQFQDQFSYGDYQTIIRDAQEKGEDPPQFMEIGQACAAELI